MSQANVEIAKRAVDAVSRRDADRFAEVMTTDLEWFPAMPRSIEGGRIKVRGRGSGVPVEAPLGIVADFRDGRISRVRGFLDHGEALWAAGPPE